MLASNKWSITTLQSEERRVFVFKRDNLNWNTIKKSDNCFVILTSNNNIYDRSTLIGLVQERHFIYLINKGRARQLAWAPQAAINEQTMEILPAYIQYYWRHRCCMWSVFLFSLCPPVFHVYVSWGFQEVVKLMFVKRE